MKLPDCRLLVAPLTPFTADGEVALDRVERQAELLLERGARGIYLAGNTGEGMLLSSEERMALTQRWRDVLDDATPIFAHIGHGSIPEARALAAHAAGVGVDAISSVGPTLFSCPDTDTLMKWSATIAEAAPDVPFVHYFTGPKPGLHPCRAGDFLARAKDQIPTFAGIKFTHEDLLDYGECLRQAGTDYRIFYGKDEAMLPALAMGAHGFIGGTYNLFGPLAAETISAFDAGRIEQAERAFVRLQRCVATLRKYGGLPALKAAMISIGMDCGPVRLPMRSLESSVTTKLIAELEQVWPQMIGATRGAAVVPSARP